MSLVAAWEFIRPEGTMEMGREPIRRADLRAHGGGQPRLAMRDQIKRTRCRLEQIITF
jgi:hypothetical protein